MTRIYYVAIGAALLFALLSVSTVKGEMCKREISTPDSLQVAQYQKHFADSIFRNLPCLKGQDDGIVVLYKDRRISHKGRFSNWKLMCGLWYTYDGAGYISTVKVYEQGIFTREVIVPKR